MNTELSEAATSTPPPSKADLEANLIRLVKAYPLGNLQKTVFDSRDCRAIYDFINCVQQGVQLSPESFKTILTYTRPYAASDQDLGRIVEAIEAMCPSAVTKVVDDATDKRKSAATPAKPTLPTLVAKPQGPNRPAQPPKPDTAAPAAPATPPPPAGKPTLVSRVATPKVPQTAVTNKEIAPQLAAPVAAAPARADAVQVDAPPKAEPTVTASPAVSDRSTPPAMKPHEYAELFPMASDEELQKMAADIKVRGLLSPITTLNGKILDGRNRYKACALAGVEPKFQEYTGTDPFADVVSWNLNRRHLTTSQKATLAAELKPFYEARAKERQEATQIKNGQTPVTANLRAPGGRHDGEASTQAAKAVGVSGRLVDDATYVKKHDGEIFEEVKAGRKTVTAAKNEIKRKESQNEAAVAEAVCPDSLTAAKTPTAPTNAAAAGSTGASAQDPHFHLVFGGGGLCIVLEPYPCDPSFDPVQAMRRTLAGPHWHDLITDFAIRGIHGLDDAATRMKERVVASLKASASSQRQHSPVGAATSCTDKPRLKIDADTPFFLDHIEFT